MAGWCGNTQLYWHTHRPVLCPRSRQFPENRVYVSPDRVDAFFCAAFLPSRNGSVVSDEPPPHRVSKSEDLQRGYRRVRIESKFGKLTALVTDGHLPHPYGREMTGYEVTNLTDTPH